MTEVSFDRVISDHLALRERNKRLEQRMPIDQYRDQVGGPLTPVSPSAPNDEPETVTVVNAAREQWLEQASWDTSGERPLPEFDWGD